MDMMTAIFAANKAKKDLQKSGGVGYSEYWGAAISFDGDIAGKETIPGEMFDVSGTYVLVDDAVLTGTNVSSVKVFASGNTFPVYDATVQLQDGIWILLFENSLFGVHPFALSFAPEVASLIGVSPGTYFWYGYLDDDVSNPCYLSYVFGALIEKAVPIDPKYLPGAVLPVVELTTVYAGSETVLTDADNAALTAAAETCLPFVLKFTVPDEAGSVTFVGTTELGLLNGAANYIVLRTIMSTLMFTLTDDGTWTVRTM